MNNYPPGVTGNEPELSGYADRESWIAEVLDLIESRGFTEAELEATNAEDLMDPCRKDGMSPEDFIRLIEDTLVQ